MHQRRVPARKYRKFRARGGSGRRQAIHFESFDPVITQHSGKECTTFPNRTATGNRKALSSVWPQTNNQFAAAAGQLALKASSWMRDTATVACFVNLPVNFRSAAQGAAVRRCRSRREGPARAASGRAQGAGRQVRRFSEQRWAARCWGQVRLRASGRQAVRESAHRPPQTPRPTPRRFHEQLGRLRAIAVALTTG